MLEALLLPGRTGVQVCCKLLDHVLGKLQKLPRLLMVTSPRLARESTITWLLRQVVCGAADWLVLQQLLTGATVKSGAVGTGVDVAHHKLETHAVCWGGKGKPRSGIHRLNGSIKERERERQLDIS